VLRHLAQPAAGLRPLYLTVKGSGGTGKSFVIKMIQKLAQRHNPGCLDEGSRQQVALAAPTGKAAFLIGGVTVHSLLGLPTKKYEALGRKRLGVLQEDLGSLRLIVLDEHSMTGLAQLGHMSRRLQEIKATSADVPFGGVSIVLVGDEGQLPPVGDTPKFSAAVINSKSPDATSKLIGREAYKVFDQDVVLLDVVHRQADGDPWLGLLTRMRENEQTKEDWEQFVAARAIDQLPITEQAKFVGAVSALFVSPSRLD